jgi:hypothetical protein
MSQLSCSGYPVLPRLSLTGCLFAVVLSQLSWLFRLSLPVLNVLYWPSFHGFAVPVLLPSCLVLALMFWLSCPLSLLFWLSFSRLSSIALLSRLFCHNSPSPAAPVLAHVSTFLCYMSCPSCPVPDALSWPPDLAVLTLVFLSWLSCPNCKVLALLYRMSYLGCPIPDVLL